MPAYKKRKHILRVRAESTHVQAHLAHAVDRPTSISYGIKRKARQVEVLMGDQRPKAETYDEGAQLVMCITFFVVTTICAAGAAWIGNAVGGSLGAVIGFLLYIVIANAGTLASLIRKPDLLPFFIRANIYRTLGIGTGVAAWLSSAGFVTVSLIVLTLAAVVIAMIASEITLLAAGRSFAPKKPDQ